MAGDLSRRIAYHACIAAKRGPTMKPEKTVNMNAIALIAALSCLTAPAAFADIALFGPGGPAAPMREAAEAFKEKTGIVVTVTVGPTAKWIDAARQDADAIFSGSQNMMDDFIEAHGTIVPESVTPLYLRPSAILVRKGNPGNITGIKDLVERDLGLMIVDGAGQIGLWEDAVGRMGDISAMAAFRKNIDVIAPNSGAALQTWKSDASLDAFLIWNHWQIENSDVADLVPTEPELTIYRDTSVAMTEKGRNTNTPEVEEFITFLSGPEGEAIFNRHGWAKSFN